MMIISTNMLRKAERLFSKADERIRETILSAELAGAEFVPFIQPVFKGDRIASGEVLLRVFKNWVYCSPERYLSAMESCELISDVTCDLLHGVETFFRSYEEALPEDFCVSFNICARQLNAPEVMNAVKRLQLQIQIVAEGVENHERLSLFKDKGVNLFQGYLFSKPVTLHEFCMHI